LGSRKEIKYEDLSNLKYTTCCIKETLRLWPIAAGLSRVSKGEFKIKDINIPDGTIIQVKILLFTKYNAVTEEIFSKSLFLLFYLDGNFIIVIIN
jgi:hypothetical protein